MPQEPHLVVTIHGIRTYGQWQERFERIYLEANRSDEQAIEFRHYQYGYFSVLAFIIPLFRWIVVRRFRLELTDLASRANWKRIDLVGHSFGTHVLAWALYGIAPEQRPKIHTIILAGSVLKASFPWRELVGRGVGRVINDCGTRDGILVLSQFWVLFTGMAGRSGFAGATGNTFRNRYSIFGHSGYFVDRDGRDDDTYMRERWLPLLVSDGVAETFDFRTPPSAWDGVLATLANNADPIKLAVYVTPFMLLIWYILGLYWTAEAQRDWAFDQQSQLVEQLSERAVEQSQVGDAIEIVLDALPQIDAARLPDAHLRLLDMLRRTVAEPGIVGHIELGGVPNAIAVAPHMRRALISYDDKIELWDIDKSVKLLKGSRIDGEIERIEMSPGEGLAALIQVDGTVHLWEMETSDIRATFATGRAGRRNCTRFLNADRLLVCEDSIRIVNARTGNSLAEIDGSPSEEWAALGGAVTPFRKGNNVQLRKVADGALVAERPFARSISTVGEAGPSTIFVGDADGEISVLSAEDATIISKFQARPRALANDRESRPYRVMPSPNGDAMVVSDDGAVRLWNSATGEQVAEIWINSLPASDVTWLARTAFLDEGRRFLTHSGGPIPAALWDTETGELIEDFGANGTGVDPLVWVSADRRWFVLRDVNSSDAMVISSHSGRVIHRFKTRGLLQAASVGDDGAIIHYTGDNLMDIFRFPPASAGAMLDGTSNVVHQADLTLEDKVLVGDGRGNVELLDERNGRIVAAIKIGNRDIEAIVVSSSYSRVVVVSEDVTALLSLPDLQLIDQSGGGAGTVAAFCEGGDLLVLASSEEAMIVDGRDGSTVANLLADQIKVAAFSPSGEELATIDSLGRVQLFRAPDWDAIWQFNLGGIASHISWLDSGDGILASSSKGAVKIAPSTGRALWQYHYSELIRREEIAVSNDGKFAAFGFRGKGEVAILELDGGTVKTRLLPPKVGLESYDIEELVFSPSGRTLAIRWDRMDDFGSGVVAAFNWQSAPNQPIFLERGNAWSATMTLANEEELVIAGSRLNVVNLRTGQQGMHNVPLRGRSWLTRDGRTVLTADANERKLLRLLPWETVIEVARSRRLTAENHGIESGQ